MNYNISINQKAIANLNRAAEDKLDLKDATILEWMMKFHAEPKSKKLLIDQRVYFWCSYQLIINENPLLDITNKETVGRRIDKLIKVGLLNKHLSKDQGNKTYFSITQSCFDLIKRNNNTLSTQKSIPIDSKVDTLSTQKSIPIDSKVDTLSTQKSNNNSISYNNTTTIEKTIKNNAMIVETMKMRYGKKVDIDLKIKEFAAFCVSTEKTHNNNNDLFSHFTYWLSTNANRPSPKNVDKEVDWFIKAFNQISKGEFKVTNDIEALFVKQLGNGFTGKEMALAVRNMYSSDDKNWHKKNGYVHATPVHFLKEDNVNKYLSQKF